MKKAVLITVIGVLFTLQLQAKKIKGWIIYDNDTVEVTMRIPMTLLAQEPKLKKLQYSLKYIDANGTKKTLTAEDAKEIRFKYMGETIRMVSVKNDFVMGGFFAMAPSVFLKLEMDGKLRLLTYYSSQHSPGVFDASSNAMVGGFAYTTGESVIQKKGEKVKRLNNFRTEMIKYFEDCPALLKKIQTKEFKRRDIRKIVYFYNHKCHSI